MISSRLIKSNNTAAGCVDIVDAYDPFAGNGVALYQLNGNATDVSGNYNGTWTGTPSYATGVFGQAATFNGSNQGISLPSVNLGSSFTISCWFKWDGVDNNQNSTIVGSSDENPSIIHNKVSTLNQIVYDTAGSSLLILSNVVSGVWYNIAITQDGTEVKTYVNGAFSSNGTVIALTATIEGIGYDPNQSRWLNGAVDQVRFFNTTLDPLEVEALYTEELCICGGTVDTLDILEDSSCIALYPLDGNANDLSGNYSGTPTAVSYGVGEFDLAGVFNGSSDIVIGSVSGLFNSKTTSTVSLWFKSTETAVGGNQWLFADYTSTSFNYVVYLNNPSVGKIRFLSRYSSATTTTDSVSTGLNNGNWHHLVVMVDIANLKHKMYIDGNFEAEGNLSSNAYNGSGALGYIGGGVTGSIDQVRIFNKALNAGEVTTLYNETACTPAACTSGTTNTLDILGDGSCIATYTLDGTPADLSGNYNGIQTDVTYPQGYFDLAGSFNGTSSYVNMGNSSGLKLLGSWGISCWVKFNSVSGLQRIINKDNANDYSGGYSLYAANNDWEFVYSNGVYNGFFVGGAFTTGVWYNLVVTFDSSNNSLKGYKNNALVANVTTTGPMTDSNDNLFFGTFGQSSPLGQYLNGSLDQVRFFNKALSAGEVTTLYNETPCN